MSSEILLSKVFPGTKYVEKVEKKLGKTAFQNIKDLTNHSSNVTKFGSSHYEGFCECIYRYKETTTTKINSFTGSLFLL